MSALNREDVWLGMFEQLWGCVFSLSGDSTREHSVIYVLRLSLITQIFHVLFHALSAPRAFAGT